VVAEVKNPVKTIRLYGFLSVLLVAVLYILCNIAYFAAGKPSTSKTKLHTDHIHV
jgi:amino acid transporter